MLIRKLKNIKFNWNFDDKFEKQKCNQKFDEHFETKMY